MLIDISLLLSRDKKKCKKINVLKNKSLFLFFLNEKTYVELHDEEIEII